MGTKSPCLQQDQQDHHKTRGKASLHRHMSKLSWAAPFWVHGKAMCSTVPFAYLLVVFSSHKVSSRTMDCAVQGQVCCCTYAVHIDTSSIWASNMWGVFLRIQLRDRFSPMGRRLSEQIAPSSWDVWSGEYYGAVTTTASAEWSPGCYCIRLKCFPGSDCREYENVETEFILSFNIISQKESTSNGISRGKSSYKTNGFLLSPCQQMINSWCWRCI